MVRWGVLAAGAAVVVGAALVTGASIPPRPLTEPHKADEIKALAVGQKTGYFNMAKVMREYRRAKTAVERLAMRRDRMSANLLGLRRMYDDLRVMHEAEKNKRQQPLVRATRADEIALEMVLVVRLVEDLDRELNKQLNNQAKEIIASMYDEMRAEVAEMAREHGLVAVLAYPDAVTPEEAENPGVKELKLKPPAAHPFYLDPSVDYTDELLQRLNAKFAAENDGK